MGKPAPEM